MAGDNDEMFMTRSLNVTPKTTVRSDKSVAYVITIKDCARRFVVVILKLTTDRHEASRGLIISPYSVAFGVILSLLFFVCLYG